MDSIVDIQGLSYAYRGFEDKQVLQNVSLQIQSGEFIAVAGRTGSGKSTLCYTLNSLVPHSFGGKMEGTVSVCGLNTRDTTPAFLAPKVGIVLQSAESQLVGLTVREDVEFGLENIMLPREQIQERVDWALGVVKLSNLQDSSPWSLSGGQKQRLAIASALAFRPQLLVLDNPTAELDPIGKQDVLETISFLNKEHGITIFIVDQELHEVLPYAHRLLILDDGKVLLLDTPAKVLDQAELVRGAGVKLPDVTEISYQLRKRKKWDGQLPISIANSTQLFGKMIQSLDRSMISQSPDLPSDNSSTQKPLIELTNVSFGYPQGKTVLQGINLTINSGDFLAIMGQNGAGKTTLAKHLNGLLKPTQGHVFVEGLDTKKESVAHLSTRVGYVFQNPDHQIFSKTVGEELSFGPKNLGWSEDRIEQAVQRALIDIGMVDRRESEPYFMGLAERKLIAIASVLIMEPHVLVLDEPATGADYNVALRIMRYISDLHKRGLTVIIITHDVSLAANYASRVIAMRDGSILLAGTPESIFQQKELLNECKISLPEVAELSNALADYGLEKKVIRVQDMVSLFEGVQ
jgi:energy-coupling factor transport system ATP-binding protein